MPGTEATDATARLGTVLAMAGVIAAADPARLRRLAAGLGVSLTGRVISSAVEPGAELVPELLAELAGGRDVLLVTDARQAATCDPGLNLIAAAAQAGIRVTALPGPSAVTAALALSGLPAERFTFEGFPPLDAKDRARRFSELAAERRTLIFAETPRRAARTLAEIAATFGAGRRAAVCRGLGTAVADVARGPLGELASRFAGGAEAESAAEVTVVVAGAPVPGAPVPGGATDRDRVPGTVGADAPGAAGTPSVPGALGAQGVSDGPGALAEAVAQVRAQVRDGTTTRDAVAAVAGQTGVRRRDLYNAVAGASPERPTGDAGQKRHHHQRHRTAGAFDRPTGKS